MTQKENKRWMFLIVIAALISGPMVADAMIETVVKVVQQLTVGGTTAEGLVTVNDRDVAIDSLKMNGIASKTADFIDIENSADTTMFQVTAVGGVAFATGLASDGYTDDPCVTLGVGKMFYNSTNSRWCNCDASTDDVRLDDATTDCF